MANTELDEETRRLIKLFRPAKDAETSWRIDVSAELAWYLDMLQQNDSTATNENVEDSSHLNQGLASVIAYEGINFSQASAVVMEATRIFSRKVDFLRKQMDSTLTTILTGAATTGQSKKAKQRKQRAATLGAVNLPEWELPEIPDSAEFMHLPLEKLTGFRTYTQDTGKHVLPLEKRLHVLAPPVVIKAPSSAPCSPPSVKDIVSEDEAMVDDCPKNDDPTCDQTHIEILTTSATDSGAPPETYPICHNLREVAIIKKQVFSRPPVHLLAPCQINPTLTGTSFHFEMFNFFKTHATTRAFMSHSGLLSFMSYQHMFISQPMVITTTRLSCSPRIGGVGDCGPESLHPGASIMQSQALSANFGGSVLNTAARPATPTNAPVKPAACSLQEPDFHDENEPIGKDAPLRLGAATQKINVKLYTMSLDDVITKLANLKTENDSEVLDNLFVALTGEYGIERLKLTKTQKQNSSLPFFTDIKRPIGSVNTYYFQWDLPPKERVAPVRAARGVPEAGANLYDENGDMGDDSEMYMADELDEATILEPGASVMHGSESIMLVDTFSRLDHRLSIIDQRATQPRGSTLGSVNILSQMHERIGVWRQRVEQWMTVAANEESFDIPTYVERIRAVKHEHNEAIANAIQDTSPEAEAPNPNEVSFREVCKGAKRHEVCRLFLTSLLLVNRYGLDIQQNDVNDFFINLDQLADEDPGL